MVMTIFFKFHVAIVEQLKIDQTNIY